MYAPNCDFSEFDTAESVTEDSTVTGKFASEFEFDIMLFKIEKVDGRER